MEAHDAAQMVLNCLVIVSFRKLDDVMVMNKRNFSRIGIDRGNIPFGESTLPTYGSVKRCRPCSVLLEQVVFIRRTLRPIGARSLDRRAKIIEAVF